MELTGKQRAYLRGMCNEMPVVLYIGKEGVTEGTVQSAREALDARELIKCAVQRGAPLSAREACDTLCEMADAQPVQCIGNRFSIYRENPENKRIGLP